MEPLVFESCHSTWLFDTERMRFRRILKGLESGPRHVATDWRAYFGLEVDPDVLVENIPVGAQQRVEIVKALMRDAQVLILDEPTAVLTPQESEGLFRVIRSLAESVRRPKNPAPRR